MRRLASLETRLNAAVIVSRKFLAGNAFWLKGSLQLALLAPFFVACSQAEPPATVSAEFDSRHSDEQPALSGDGRFLALVSNRDGNRGILLYDRKQRQMVNLPRLNRRNAIAESPSLSYTGRYIVYITSDSVRPEIELYDRVLQQPQVLTAGYRGWFRNPSISLDGRYVSFETGARGQWDIEVLDRGPNVESDVPDELRSRLSSPP